MVGEELERSVCLGVTVFDATQGLRVAVGGLGTGEDDGLVTAQAGGVIDRSGITAAVTDISLVADNEEGGGEGEGKQASR